MSFEPRIAQRRHSRRGRSHQAFELLRQQVAGFLAGERQRVLIARSLATEAPIILLDEPTANLDIAHALDLLALCRALAREGKAIAIALHDLNLAARFADEIVLLDRGVVAACGATAAVLSPEIIGEVFGVQVKRASSESGEEVFLFHHNRRNH